MKKSVIGKLILLFLVLAGTFDTSVINSSPTRANSVQRNLAASSLSGITWPVKGSDGTWDALKGYYVNDHGCKDKGSRDLNCDRAYQLFGFDLQLNNSGSDTKGKDVISPVTGKVVHVYNGNYPGSMVVIRVDGTQNLMVALTHIDNPVSEGTGVTMGDQNHRIGIITNDAGNTHLHFNLYTATSNDSDRAPVPFMNDTTNTYGSYDTHIIGCGDFKPDGILNWSNKTYNGSEDQYGKKKVLSCGITTYGYWIGPTPTGTDLAAIHLYKTAIDPQVRGIDLGYESVDSNGKTVDYVDFWQCQVQKDTNCSTNQWVWIGRVNAQNKYHQNNSDLLWHAQEQTSFNLKSPGYIAVDVHTTDGNWHLAENGIRALCVIPPNGTPQCPSLNTITYHDGSVRSPGTGGGGAPGDSGSGGSGSGGSNPSNGVVVYSGANYSGSFEAFTYNGDNNRCVNLDQMVGNNDSIGFLGGYSGDYDSVMYHDANCGTYLARYSGDVPDFSHNILQNQFSSMRIEYTGSASNGFQVFQNVNYSGDSEVFHYTSHDTCINLDKMAGKQDSLKFTGSYIGWYSAVMYHDTGCGTFLARYEQDYPDLSRNILQNQFSSMRLELHTAPGTPGGPQPTDGSSVSTSDATLSWDGASDTSQIHIWGTNYDFWKTWTPGNTLALHGLVAGTYSWQVQTQNSLGASPWSPVWTFTITSTSANLQATWIEPTNNWFNYEPGMWYNLQAKFATTLAIDHLNFKFYSSDGQPDLCGNIVWQGVGTTYSCNRDFRWTNNMNYPTGGTIWFSLQVTDKDGAVRTPTDGWREGTYRTEIYSGTWNTPQNGFTIAAKGKLHMSATVLAGNSNPAIDHINFRAIWNGQATWIDVCKNVGGGSVLNEYACDWDTSTYTIPANSQVRVAFDAYRPDGTKGLSSPDGDRVGTYAVPVTPPQGIWNTPQDNFTVAKNGVLHFSANVTGSVVSKVNFRATWNSTPWVDNICSLQVNDSHLYECDWNIAANGVPDNTFIRTAFDAYDANGTKILSSPDGDRVGMYTPAQDATQVSPKNGSVLPLGTTSTDVTFSGTGPFTIHAWDLNSHYDVWTANITANTYHLKGLQAGVSYNWQVLGSGTQNWSSTWKFSLAPKPAPKVFENFSNGKNEWILTNSVAAAKDGGNGILRFTNPSKTATAAKTVNTAALAQYNTITIRINLHGATLPSGTSAELFLDQSGLKYVSLSKYVKQCVNGWQTITIPLKDFSGFTSSKSFARLGINLKTSSRMTIDVDNITFLYQ